VSIVSIVVKSVVSGVKKTNVVCSLQCYMAPLESIISGCGGL
jgi:hypothetical protein